MNRRVLVDAMAEDPDLAKVGVVANLVFDRLLTVTDDAGLCPGEPVIVTGRCFPLLGELTIEQIATALDALVEAGILLRGTYRGRVVLCFKSKPFQAHQKFRADYKRKFGYDDLSELVWNDGLDGFRAGAGQQPNGSRSDAERIAPASGASTTTRLQLNSTSAQHQHQHGASAGDRSLQPPTPSHKADALSARERNGASLSQQDGTLPLRGDGRRAEEKAREDFEAHRQAQINRLQQHPTNQNGNHVGEKS